MDYSHTDMMGSDKMVYQEYVRCKREYEKSIKILMELLDEKTLIFMKTQPKSPVTDYERIDGGERKNKNEEYVSELEEKRIDERIENAKNTLSGRNLILMSIQDDLRLSKNKYDMVYCCRWLDGMRTGDISRYLNYSESHVYRIIKKIKKDIKIIENERK